MAQAARLAAEQLRDHQKSDDELQKLKAALEAEKAATTKLEKRLTSSEKAEAKLRKDLAQARDELAACREAAGHAVQQAEVACKKMEEEFLSRMRMKDMEVNLLKETWGVQERRIHHLKEMVARLKGDAWEAPRRNGRMPEDIGGFREHPPDAAAGGYGYRTPASSRSTVTPEEAMSRALREGWQAKLISRSQACMLLGLSGQPLQAEVQKVRKQMALRWHPDKNPDDAQAHLAFQLVMAAAEKLST